jgi:hypothetical protein
MAVLKHMLKKAVEWGMLEGNPFKKGQKLMFKENNHRLRFLSEAEIEALIAICPPHLRPIVETALLIPGCAKKNCSASSGSRSTTV